MSFLFDSSRCTAWTVSIGCLCLLLSATSCAPKRLALPAGAGSPVADFHAPFEEASSACRAVHTLTAEVHLSGRAGSQKMRGTLLTGVEQPDSLRLEGVAPFGPPAFILVARGGSATLLLPRDDRVLAGVSGADILEALAGVRLDPATLRAILAGCVAPDPQPSGGRSYPGGWMGVDLAKGAVAFLRQSEGRWRIVAGEIAGLAIEYQQFEAGQPRRVFVQTLRGAADEAAGAGQAGRVNVDLSLSLSQVVVNSSLKPNAFEVQVPRNAAPLTLEELRESGPLGEKK